VLAAFWSLDGAFWPAVLVAAFWSLVVLVAAFWSLEVAALGAVVVDWPDAAFWSLVLGVVAVEPVAEELVAAEPVALWSVELGGVVVVAAEPVALWSVELGGVVVDGVVADCPLMLPAEVVLDAFASLVVGGCELGVVWLVEDPVVLWSLGGVEPEEVLEFGGTEAVPPALASFVLRGGGTALVFGFVFVWSALVLPLPTVLEGVWLVTGGVVLDGVCVLVVALLWSGLVVVAGAVPVCPAPMLLEEPVLSAEGLLVCAEVAPVVAAPVLPAACWLVQVSEITFTELTCSEPSEDCVPVISTWWASFGLRVESSPITLMVWPLSEASVQLPPDCFRQPRRVVCWPPAFAAVVEDVVVDVVLCEVLGVAWSVVEGCWADGSCVVEGCCAEGCWSGVAEPLLPPPACANAMPEASISAIKSFLFIRVLLRSFTARKARRMISSAR
jgi:hypothetical protein